MSTALTRADVARIAELARLELTADELELFTRQLGDILDYVEQIRGLDTSGVAPKDIFDAPTHGLRELMKRNNLTPKDVDLFELNEAFAAQVLTNITQLGIPEDKLNICGGGIALGHPIGGSGARVLTTLLHQMQRIGAKRGIASLCLGGGNSVNMLVERA